MKIFVVGIGPGARANMSEEAISVLQNSEVIVGYNKYIELARELIDPTKQKVISTGMMGEVERCSQAIQEALLNKTVAVISSGDAGIYGMAGLVLELAEEYPEIEIQVVSGITAAVSAAAVLGAPLTNDFAVISLSDLLTPWEVIEKRLNAASQGDFAIALYNPSSIKRSDYLEKACNIILKHRDKGAFCGYVRNIQREGCTHGFCTLEELRHKKVDMFTTVIIGNSQTKMINGRLVTSRGYQYV